MTDAEIDAQFIDGNKLREGAAVVMTSGTGKTKAPLPIIDRTAEDQDAGGGSSSGLVKPRTGKS